MKKHQPFGFIETYKGELYGFNVEYCLEGRKKLNEEGRLVIVNLIKNQNQKFFSVYYFNNSKEGGVIYSNPDLVCNYNKNPLMKNNVKKYIEKCLDLFDEKTKTFDYKTAAELNKQFNTKDNEGMEL